LCQVSIGGSKTVSIVSRPLERLNVEPFNRCPVVTVTTGTQYRSLVNCDPDGLSGMEDMVVDLLLVVANHDLVTLAADVRIAVFNCFALSN